METKRECCCLSASVLSKIWTHQGCDCYRLNKLKLILSYMKLEKTGNVHFPIAVQTYGLKWVF